MHLPNNDEPALHLTVRFRELTREEVISRHYGDVMQGGMLIRTRQDPAIALGTNVVLRFLLAGGEEIFRGVGMVAWRQEMGAQLGVGIRFLELSPASAELYRELLAEQELIAFQQPDEDEEVFDDGPTLPWRATGTA